MNKPSELSIKSDPVIDERVTEILYNRYCQVFVHQSGQIQINGEAAVVRAIIKRLAAAGFIIRWDYHSRCG